MSWRNEKQRSNRSHLLVPHLLALDKRLASQMGHSDSALRLLHLHIHHTEL